MARVVGGEVFPVANPDPARGGPVWMFVRLDTDDGIRGYGEVFTSFAWMKPLTYARLVSDFLDDFVIGRGVGELEALRQEVRNAHYSRTPDLVKSAVLSGVDIALWDIIGQRSGVPVCELLGGAVRRGVPTYSYLDPPAGVEPEELWSDPDAVGARATELAAEGLLGVKFDPAPLLTGSSSLAGQFVPVQPTSALLDRIAGCVESVRRAVGDGVEVIVGTHGQFTPSGALRVAREIEPFRPLWMEEPVPPGRADDLGRVARATSVPIAAGERLSDLGQFSEIVTRGSVGVVNPDVSLIGGITEARRVAGLAEAFGAQFSPHVYGGPVVAAASMHVALAAPNLLTMEGIGRFDGVHAEVLDAPLRWEDGHLLPTTTPGLGHALDEGFARAHAVDDDSRFMSAVLGSDRDRRRQPGR